MFLYSYFSYKINELLLVFNPLMSVFFDRSPPIFSQLVSVTLRHPGLPLVTKISSDSYMSLYFSCCKATFQLLLSPFSQVVINAFL